MRRSRIKASREAIDDMGGAAVVARLFANVAPRTVWMWRKRGLPAKAWVVLAPELKLIHRFSPDLFGMLKPNPGGQNGNQ